jgi:hypothetical protein
MRTILLTILIMAVCHSAMGQNLMTLYKGGQVILEEDKSYGAANNWKEVFFDIDYGWDRLSDGKNRAIAIAPDGTVFMSHRSRHSLSMYDKNGNYVKDFGRRGTKESDFANMPYVAGVLDSKYVVTYAVDGRMLFFDLAGNWVKTHVLDYMPLESTMLSDGKLAILGSTQWATKTRTLIAIKDYQTGTEKIVWDRFVDLTELAKKASTGQFSAVSSSPSEQQVYVRPRIMADKEGNLVMVLPGSGEVKTFSPDGKLLKSYTLDTGERMQITQQDRADYSNRMKERAAASEKAINETTDQAMKERHRRTAVQMRELADIYLDPAKYPGHLPALSQAMLDSDGNLLIFLFTSEKDQNRFNVYAYDKDGGKIGESSFISRDYNLDFSSTKFIFHNGDVIGIQFLKERDKQIPLRLVRFKLKN